VSAGGGSVRRLLLDVGGVLSPDIIELKLRHLATAHGLEEAPFMAAGLALRREADRGCMDEEGFWSRALTEAGVAPTPADLDFASYLELDPNALALCRRVAARVPTGILSNDTLQMSRARRDAGAFDEHFSPIVISAEVGVTKPDPAIYRIALERCGCEPGQCLFVDDRDPNILGAREVGMQTHLYRGVEGLRRTLKRLEIL